MMITLTGFMGSGKTTVGKVLADFLGCPFMDLDDLVVKKAGKSIPDIFAQDGEPAFRQLEAQVLRKTVEKYALHEKTVCIYLRATLDTLLARLEGETAGRPLADASLADRLASREPIYEETAHVIIDTDGLSPDEVADEIIISAL